MHNKIFLFFTLLLASSFSLMAQPALEKDYSFVMEIPSVITMESSPAHLYVLSETEGMVVFRSQQDSLQWLYSSTGMEQRGHSMTADIRFAYLFGDSQRLTVLEPTSVLGVYSATQLPARPIDATRMEQDLYVALGNQGMGKLSLQTPSSVDSTVQFIDLPEPEEQEVIALESSSEQIFALSSNQQLYQFDFEDGQLSLTQTFELDEPLQQLFLISGTLFGSTESGNIYEINGAGDLSLLGSIEENIIQLEAWNDWLIIKGNSGRLWTSYQSRRPELWKKDRQAGNFFTVSNGNLWLCEYDQISRITTSSRQNISENQPAANGINEEGTLSLQDIADKTIPHSKPLLLPLELNNEVPAGTVQFTYQSPDINNAEIRGHSFLWQPSSSDVGMHQVKIIATTSGGQTDSTSFAVEVRSFNAPPRFAPIRPMTIPAGEEFSLPVSAVDPDGITTDLIRFLGVDMPDGASIDEVSGNFTWTPSARQVGENSFRVIATDQYGAASSVDITINVVENIRRDNSES